MSEFTQLLQWTRQGERPGAGCQAVSGYIHEAL